MLAREEFDERRPRHGRLTRALRRWLKAGLTFALAPRSATCGHCGAALDHTRGDRVACSAAHRREMRGGKRNRRLLARDERMAS